MTPRPSSHPDSARLSTNERGASMVEYSLLVILIAIVAFVAVQSFGTELSSTFSTIATSMAEAGG